jgi:hypothetical protein
MRDAAIVARVIPNGLLSMYNYSNIPPRTASSSRKSEKLRVVSSGRASKASEYVTSSIKNAKSSSDKGASGILACGKKGCKLSKEAVIPGCIPEGTPYMTGYSGGNIVQGYPKLAHAESDRCSA